MCTDRQARLVLTIASRQIASTVVVHVAAVATVVVTTEVPVIAVLCLLLDVFVISMASFCCVVVDFQQIISCQW